MAMIETNNLVAACEAIASCFIGEGPEAQADRYAACCAFLAKALELELGLVPVSDAACHAYWSNRVGDVGTFLDGLAGGA